MSTALKMVTGHRPVAVAAVARMNLSAMKCCQHANALILLSLHNSSDNKLVLEKSNPLRSNGQTTKSDDGQLALAGSRNTSSAINCLFTSSHEADATRTVYSWRVIAGREREREDNGEGFENLC